MIRVGDLEQGAEFMLEGERLMIAHKQPNPHVSPLIRNVAGSVEDFYLPAWTMVRPIKKDEK